AGAATSAHGVSQVVTLASGGIAGHSIFFKKGTNNYAYINVSGAAGNYITVVFDLLNGAVGETKTGGISGSISSTSIRHVGGGVYRCAVIGSIGATNPTVEFGLATAASGNTFTAIGEVTFSAVGTEAIYGWGGQSETAGVGITSYIPTGGTSVTRAADVLSLPLTAVSGWNASKGGVLMGTIRLHTLGPNATPTAVMIEDAGLNNLVGIEAAYGAGLQRGELWSGGVSQARPQGVAARAPFVRTKITFGWGMTRTQIANDGNLANTVIGAFLLPVGPTKISIGNSGGAAQLNGAVESIAYYTGARSDAFVQSVSQ
ncbi:MAG: phage head spike fiber domain-containing protein, partial [Rhodospirillaceae bacterium]